MRRMFDQGDLRLVVLALIAEQPRHGYDLIKEIESRVGGAYAPSPGAIYPLLTMLEDLGHVALSASDGSKKLYAITSEGQAELAANKQAADVLFARLDAARESASGARAPQLMRAWENLKFALNLRVERGPLTDDQVRAIAAALDDAAQAIEQT
ncbi:MAG: PadR family transcriptional regulator [Hyphomonadaceae bacterium]